MILTSNDFVGTPEGVYSYVEGADPVQFRRVIIRAGDGVEPDQSDRVLRGTVLIGTYAYKGPGNTARFAVHRTVKLYDTPIVVMADELFGGSYASPTGFSQWGMFVIPAVTGWDFIVDYYDNAE